MAGDNDFSKFNAPLLFTTGADETFTKTPANVTRDFIAQLNANGGSQPLEVSTEAVAVAAAPPSPAPNRHNRKRKSRGQSADAPANSSGDGSKSGAKRARRASPSKATPVRDNADADAVDKEEDGKGEQPEPEPSAKGPNPQPQRQPPPPPPALLAAPPPPMLRRPLRRRSAPKAISTRPIPRTLAECSPADTLLLRLRDAGHDWPLIRTRWSALTGETTAPSTLPNRYTRLKAKLAVLEEEDHARLLRAKASVEASFEAQKWALVAKVVGELGGRVYEGAVCRRAYRGLMEGAGVRPSAGVRDGDFEGSGEEGEGVDDGEEEGEAEGEGEGEAEGEAEAEAEE